MRMGMLVILINFQPICCMFIRCRRESIRGSLPWQPSILPPPALPSGSAPESAHKPCCNSTPACFWILQIRFHTVRATTRWFLLAFILPAAGLLSARAPRSSSWGHQSWECLWFAPWHRFFLSFLFPARSLATLVSSPWPVWDYFPFPSSEWFIPQSSHSGTEIAAIILAIVPVLPARRLLRST